MGTSELRGLLPDRQNTCGRKCTLLHVGSPCSGICSICGRPPLAWTGPESFWWRPTAQLCYDPLLPRRLIIWPIGACRFYMIHRGAYGAPPLSAQRHASKALGMNTAINFGPVCFPRVSSLLAIVLIIYYPGRPAELLAQASNRSRVHEEGLGPLWVLHQQHCSVNGKALTPCG